MFISRRVFAASCVCATLLFAFNQASRATSTAATSPTPAHSPTPKPMKPKSAPITFTLKTDKKVYHAGEKIRLTMTVRNTSKQTQPMTFGSGQSFDVIAYGANGTPVWQWARGLFFTMSVREESLGAGQTLTYAEVWDGKDKDGKTLAPGVYKLEAKLKRIEQKLTSAPVFVTIKAK